MRALFANLPLKLISLLLAVLLWFVIAGEQTSEMGIHVPIEIKNMPKDLELMGDLVETVEVRLRATPGVIHRLTPADVLASLDLADVREGEHIVHLTDSNIRVPFGVKVVKVSPPSLRLWLEPVQEGSVPVRPRLTGQPAPGFELVEVVVDPAEVRINGPRRRVRAVTAASTEPISIEGANQTVEATVNLDLEDPMLRIAVSPAAKVTARIRETLQRRTFDGLTVEVPAGAGLNPSRIRVVLEGPATAIRALSAAQLRATVDLSGFHGPQKAVAVAIGIVPTVPGVTVLRVEPPVVTARIVKRGE